MAYVSLADMLGYLNVQTTPSPAQQALLQSDLAAAQTEIERYCHRRFEAPADQTRSYDATDLQEERRRYGHQFSWDTVPFHVNQQVLVVHDDLLSITTLTNGDGTVIPSGGYVLLPRNAPAQGEPYAKLALTSAYAWQLGQDQVLQITGRFAWSLTAPDAIVVATKMLAAYYWHQRDAQTSDVIQLPDGSIQVPKGFPANVKLLLDKGAWKRAPIIA